MWCVRCPYACCRRYIGSSQWCSEKKRQNDLFLCVKDALLNVVTLKVRIGSRVTGDCIRGLYYHALHNCIITHTYTHSHMPCTVARHTFTWKQSVDHNGKRPSKLQKLTKYYKLLETKSYYTIVQLLLPLVVLSYRSSLFCTRNCFPVARDNSSLYKTCIS